MHSLFIAPCNNSNLLKTVIDFVGIVNISANDIASHTIIMWFANPAVYFSNSVIYVKAVSIKDCKCINLIVFVICFCRLDCVLAAITHSRLCISRGLLNLLLFLGG